MALQRTVQGTVALQGVDLYGGNKVNLFIDPADENTGILFKTPYGDVQANLDNATAERSALCLRNNRGGAVLHVEHLLAALYAYGVDNAVVSLQRVVAPHFRVLRSLGLATNVEVVPTFEEREKTLCYMLDEVGTEEQQRPRRIYYVHELVSSERFTLEPRMDANLVIQSKTEYLYSGTQGCTLVVSPASFRDNVAAARPYAKHAVLPGASFLAALANPTFGLSHGFSKNTVFLPPKSTEEWRARDRFGGMDEIARHSVVDRLGALALLGRRIEGVKVRTEFSGHANDLEFLRANRGVFKSYRP